MLHGKNQTVYGDCLALSDEFVSKFYKKSDKEIIAGIPTGKYRVTKGIFKGHIFNGHEIIESKPAWLYPEDEGEVRIWDDDSVGRSYPVEHTELLSEANEASIKISSKQELPKLGYTSVAPGIYRDAKHHLWQLSRDGEGYVIERTADEETIRKAKETKTAKLSFEQFIKATNLSALRWFIHNKVPYHGTESFDKDYYKINIEEGDISLARVAELYPDIYNVYFDAIKEYYYFYKDKGVKNSFRKSATIFKVEQEFTIPGFEDVVFSPDEEIETFKTSVSSDKYQTSIIQNMLGREVPIMDTTLSNLIQSRYITKIAKISRKFLVVDSEFNQTHYPDIIGETFDEAPGYAQVRIIDNDKISSRLTTKSDMPLDDFSNDLNQSGVYYQKGSQRTDTESGKLITDFEVEDKDLDTFKTIASDYGIIVEANKTALNKYKVGDNVVYDPFDRGDPHFPELIGHKGIVLEVQQHSDYEGYVPPSYKVKFDTGFIPQYGISGEDLVLSKFRQAEIEESKKVFSDEAIIKGISLLINMGFTKNEAIKEFIASNELDSEYKKNIENILDKYKI